MATLACLSNTILESALATVAFCTKMLYLNRCLHLEVARGLAAALAAVVERKKATAPPCLGLQHY